MLESVGYTSHSVDGPKDREQTEIGSVEGIGSSGIDKVYMNVFCMKDGKF
jgi:hypothetical protein